MYSAKIKKITMLVLSITLFMDVMDTNVLNTALPAMARSFHANPVDLKIALISYLLSFAIFIPTSGWVADRFGTKRIFIAALLLFTISSFFCGFSKTLPQIVNARFYQGIGGAFMVSLGRLMIARVFKRHELVEAMNTVIMVVSVAVMTGPFIGGFIVDHFKWSWIFWVNIPVGVVLIILTSIFLEDTPDRKKTPFDFIGFILFAGGLSLLCFSLSELSESHMNLERVLLRLALSISALTLYVFYALKREHPLIQVRLFSIRTFRISVVGNIFSRIGFGGIPFLFPLMQQIAFKFSAQLSGLSLIPIAFGMIVAKTKAVSYLRKLGYRRYLMWNTVILSIILFLFQCIHPWTSFTFMVLLTFIFGLFISAQYTAMNSLAFSDIPDEKLSASTSITSTVQILGQSLGVAAGAILLRLYAHFFSKHFKLTTPIFHYTFSTLSVLTLLAIFIFMRLKPMDGAAMLFKTEDN